jgi:hypothetical protein
LTQPDEKEPSFKAQHVGIWLGLLLVFLGTASSFVWMPLLWPQLSPLTALEKRLFILESQQKEVSKTAADAMSDLIEKELGALKADIAALQLQNKALERERTASLISQKQLHLLLAFLALKTKIQSGESYTQELAHFQKFTSENLYPLDLSSETGAPTLQTLARELMEAQKQPSLETNKQPLTLWEKVSALFHSLVKIEKITPVTHQAQPCEISPSFIFSLQRGDLSAVLAQMDIKTPALDVWRTQAESYMAIQEKLKDLEQKLF